MKIVCSSEVSINSDHINGHRMLEDSTVVLKPRILHGERQYVCHVNAIQLVWLFVRMCVWCKQ
jgi:hypothetical protein